VSAGVRLERSGRVATIVFDRPEAKNAIDLATMDALDRIVFDLEGDPEVSAVIVTGAGGSFVSGGDIKDFGRIVGPEAAREMSLKMQAILQRLSELPVPSLAAIDGDAHGGGCEVALFPDIRVGPGEPLNLNSSTWG
jgi:enoyl-CoA hydratase/carnithine racemase